MKSLTRGIVVAAAASLALAGCSGDPGEDVSFTSVPSTTETTTDAAETTTETVEPSDDAGSDTDADADGDADGDADTDTVSLSDARSGEVLVSATAPEGPEGGKNGIIKTGENDYELTGDYINRDTLRDLPRVSWKPPRDLERCTVTVTYLSEDGREIAEADPNGCEHSRPAGGKEVNADWLDRSALPEQGETVPVTIHVVVEGREEAVDGELIINLTNPDTYQGEEDES